MAERKKKLMAFLAVLGQGLPAWVVILLLNTGLPRRPGGTETPAKSK